ncbi:opacity protein-like surface antigen [Bartonella japonica]|uniref:Opacity protein-like surface antigen n=1 Tax=Bartonella japonica TaxID=357761 RepID=A0ABV2FN16_9HYPH
MNTRFITASVFAFVSASGVQAADVISPEEPEHVASSVIVSPSFSWSGFYFGGQIGGFSSKTSAMTPDVDVPLFPDAEARNKDWIPVEKKYMPKLSGFTAGLYTGVNFNTGKGFILGIDTDLLLSERKDTKSIVITAESEPEGTNTEGTDTEGTDTEGTEEDGKQKKLLLSLSCGTSRLSGKSDEKPKEKNSVNFSHTLKQKWSGATRVRVGLPVDRIMPYISGGIAYGQFQDILSVLITGEDAFSATSDTTKTMIGYTLGGGVDFAITDDVIMRAEYRYSDFGKKKFKDEIEIKHKTNDFRAGIAYKF